VALIAAKDLRVEWRSRVALNQIVPLALLVLVLFAFALDPDRGVLTRVTPGLYWVAVLLCALLAVQRSFAVEAADGVRDALRLSAIEPAALHLGKVVAVGAQLLALEVVLLAGVALLYNTSLGDGGPPGALLLAATCLVATLGIAAAGTLFGVLAAGVRLRETLLPLLLLPALAPVLLGATRAFEAALAGDAGAGWPWLGLLGLFAVVYIGVGAAAYGPLLEES
jgi:heme exporter protein B